MSKSVIIIGCGIAGPVLAMLLKHTGIEPVIYECKTETEQAGLALGVTPQTFKVLNILGLAEKVVALGQSVEHFISYSELLGGTVLVERDTGSLFRRLGWPMVMLSRARDSHFLCDSAKGRGIPVHFNKTLIAVRQAGDRVTTVFEDGTTSEADLLVGCDGLHSAVRDFVLPGTDAAQYMGLVQIGGFTPTPDIFKASKPGTSRQIFGDGAHFMGMPINDSQMLWVTTFAEPDEARENWRRLSINDSSSKEMLSGLRAAGWGNGAKELIQGSTFITKYGLYERTMRDVWHKGRVVLVGDAAHPTSPHLGQGANQAMEDCYHLVRLLCKAEPLEDESLEAAFTEYEHIRVPIVSLAVAGAKKEGENRVMSGERHAKHVTREY
ncbi:FAD/NAD(P)-binding domain-containing protein [Calocera cornea HHB12733]|uniref:FAD/NAD(P)-binding domain-containing protein n=1 Tax=Calocera cornea HHB12733 TaxID=1353952 RepID=A0A165EFM7_9BASI|nr:FAD/NAD(P)-binding domain-containing protein [Calocera cornea HHB12733]